MNRFLRTLANAETQFWRGFATSPVSDHSRFVWPAVRALLGFPFVLLAGVMFPLTIFYLAGYENQCARTWDHWVQNPNAHRSGTPMSWYFSGLFFSFTFYVPLIMIIGLSFGSSRRISNLLRDSATSPLRRSSVAGVLARAVVVPPAMFCLLWFTFVKVVARNYFGWFDENTMVLGLSSIWFLAGVSLPTLLLAVRLETSPEWRIVETACLSLFLYFMLTLPLSAYNWGPDFLWHLGGLAIYRWLPYIVTHMLPGEWDRLLYALPVAFHFLAIFRIECNNVD